MPKNSNLQFWILGITFAAFWSSASPAAKIGLHYAEPLTLFQIRFFGAALLMFIILGFQGQLKMPSKAEWLPLTVFGLLNITLYLSLFVYAVSEIAAGIGSMSTSLCPIMIAVLSQIILGKKAEFRLVMALIIGFLGVSLAVWPLLQNAYASPKGLLLLLGSMLSYSLGTIYYTKQTWQLNRLQINAWQVLFGGILLLPLTLWKASKPLIFSTELLAAEFWLIVPVSILAVNLWLKLISIDTRKAALFMFLCPIFGFILAVLLLNEPFSWHTGIGTLLVLVALFLGQTKVIKKKEAI
jgi:probable blue pigment (indigoidine) exporter